MARWTAGGVSSGTIGSTYALGVQPKAVVTLGASTAAADTTQAEVSGVGVGLAVSTASVARLGYAGAFSGTSAKTQASLLDVAGFIVATTAAGLTASQVTVLDSTFVGRGTTDFNHGFAVMGGDDLQSFKPVVAPISTVAASTQASTGYGFQPNAAIFLGQSHVTSVGNFSFGFACIDTAGTRTQWAIGNGAREAAGVNAAKTATTAGCLVLPTTAAVAHQVNVSSFRADGLELTVPVTDPARAAMISVLGLNVPRVAAGKTSVTTNGVGAGQTGITVTGLGQNVGLVIVASIGQASTALSADNCWSIGFASSNNSQRVVSGYAQNGGNGTSHYASYFGTSHVCIFTSANGGSSGAVVKSMGTFAVTTNGFTINFTDTAGVATTHPNTRDIYWAALSNTVQDIESHILSVASVQANLVETARISASIVADWSVQANLEPEFQTGRGKLAGKAEIVTEVIQDDDRFRNVVENSSSPDISKTFDLTTVKQRIGLAGFGNAKNVSILPPSTNTRPFRIAGSLQSAGVQVSSRGVTNIPLPEDSGQDIYLYSTSSTGTVPGVRVNIR